MASETFKIGEVVVLNSGGPDMTVEEVSSTSGRQIKCQWFGGKKLEHGWFPIASLKKVQPKSP